MEDCGCINRNELRERVAARLASKKPVMLASLAEDLGVTELKIAHVLPDDMVAFTDGDAFERVWTDIAEWEKVTFIMVHQGNVIEVKGRIPTGFFAQGYYNITGESTFGGHIKAYDVEEICFLSMPFMGLESHSVQFFNDGGSVMFSIYVGREKHKLIPAVSAAFFALRDKLCTRQE